MTSLPPQRVSPIAAPDDYVLPGRPESAVGASVQDAFRQTQFLLGGELELFARSMQLQIRLVKDAYPSKFRTHALAALMALWSRAHATLADAMLLLTRASYGSIPPLVRAVCELVAAEEGLRAGEMELYKQWLAGTLHPDETFKAFEFELGRYFAGEVLATDATLRSVYRPAAELGRPAFGATLLQTGPESNNNRVAIAFADRSFHFGWAELDLGWLLALSLRQLRVIIESEGIFPVVADLRAEYEALRGEVKALLARSDRCRIEEVTQDKQRRLLVHNFRRASSGAPKKVLL